VKGAQSSRKAASTDNRFKDSVSALADLKASKESSDKLDAFNWLDYESTAEENMQYNAEKFIVAGEKISAEERKLRMLKQLAKACMTCSMCELGRSFASKNSEMRDPHIFSNQKVSKIMVVGQSPSWSGLQSRKPFTSTAGKSFKDKISQHGVSCDDLYITNIVRCYTEDMEDKYVESCEPFLRMEINLLKPKVIVALGPFVFSKLCPNGIFEAALKKLCPSKYGVKVFPINHLHSFEDQIRILCGLIRRLC